MTGNGGRRIGASEYRPPRRRWIPRLRIRSVSLVAVAGAVLAATLIYFLFTSTSIRITTSPLEASIDIREFHIPVADRFLVRTGTLTVVAELPGYRPLETDLDVKRSGDHEYRLELEPLPGRLAISLQPDFLQADVFVDGNRVGSAPGEVGNIPSGRHSVVVDAPLYRAWQTELEVEGRDILQSLDVVLEAAHAPLRLETVPGGAEIELDGQQLGQTPLEFEIEEGSQTLVLELEGYKPYPLTIQVEAGQPMRESVQLEPVDARLAITSTPAGAAVTLDDTYIGQTPLSVDAAPGNRRVRLYLAGYSRTERAVELISGETRELSIPLDPETVAVRFSIAPDDAIITVDGRRIGTGSGTYPLQTRRLQIEISKPGYRSWTTELVPSASTQQVVSTRLLTEEEAAWAEIPSSYRTRDGQQFTLFRDPGRVELGSPRREAGRRANEFEFVVDLNRAFYAGLYEVTNAQYRRYDPTHSSGNFEGRSLDGGDQPVVNISWQQAALYCNWLSEQEGLPPFYTTQRGFVSGYNPASTGYRLLSEAEWTWLARSGTVASAGTFPWGDSESPTTAIGNIADQSIADAIGFTLDGYRDGYPVSSPVGSFDANGNGVYDLYGNVAEWVNDWYRASPFPEQPPADFLGPEIGEFHVIRGASWARGYLPQLRVAYRDYDADGRNDVGFRIGRYAR